MQAKEPITSQRLSPQQVWNVTKIVLRVVLIVGTIIAALFVSVPFEE
jgi:hypothetical protein